MRKFILTLTTLCIALLMQAQEVNTMYIYHSNGNIEEIPIAEIDSITFTKPITNTPDDEPTISFGTGEAIDLGLSVKWASCNVGATSPEECGGYYAWGETEEKIDYTWDTYKYCNDSNYQITKYCTNSSYGTVDNKTTLDLKDDVAHVKWGGNWRMPTREELEELFSCDINWVVYNGVYGYKITGPNGNSIFLPLTGYRSGTEILKQDTHGIYRSKTVANRSNCAYRLRFDNRSYDFNLWDFAERCLGLTVRPVCD